MTKQVQSRRGTASQHTSFTGAEGEISVNTTNKSVHVHDGVTAGGVEAARADLDNVSAADILSTAGITATATELNYTDGVTSAIQTQLDAKAPINSATFTGTTTIATADINGGTIDGVTIATSDITVGAAKTLDVSAGTLTLADDQISGDKIEGGTIGSVAITSADINGGTIDGTVIGGTTPAAVTATSLTATGTTTLAGASTTADITFGDNDKAIFGAGSDLQIYHNGGNSVISDVGTGDLYLAGDNLRLTNAALSEIYARGYANGKFSLYYDNAEKLATTATGVDVTGTVTADGLTVDATESYINGRLRLESGANSQDLRFSDTSTTDQNAQLRLSSGSLLVQSQNNAFNAATTRAAFANNGDISFYEDTGTTPKFFWDASAESLGIGTSSPSQLAHLYESTAATGAFLQVQEVGGQNAYFGVNTSGGSIQVSGANPLQIATNGAERMRIDSSGNVGIGTSSPAVLSHVAAGYTAPTGGLDAGIRSLVSSTGYTGLGILSASNASAYVHFGDPDDSDVGGIIYGHSSNHMQFNVNASERMRIDSSGNVGIGTSSPVFSSGGGLLVNNATAGNVRVTNGTQSGEFRADSTNVYIGSRTSGSFVFEQFGSERMRIDASGNLLVGTTSANGTEILQLAAGGVQWSTGPNTTNGSFDVLNASGTGVYLSSGSTAWAGLSDERFKDIIEPISNASDKVLSLRPIIGKYKTDEAGVRRSFLIAQDVQAVFPEAVDAGDKNKLGLRYGDMVPLLTAALQEALNEIAALKDRVAALEA